MSALNSSDLISIAVTAAVLYEYALTLALEMRQYWGRPVKLPSVLFFANRYLCLADRLITFIGILTGASDIWCSILLWSSGIYAVIALLVIAVLSAARVYALWYPRIWPSILIAACALLAPIVCIIDMKLALESVQTGAALCRYSLHTGTVAFNFFYAARVMNMVPDILVVMFTWMKTHRLIGTAKRLGLTSSLSAIVLRSGIYYFAAATVCSVGLLILTQASNVIMSTADLVALSAILMSRFMLTLRRAVLKRDTRVQIVDQRHTSMLGDLGEWLDGDDDLDIDERHVDDHELITFRRVVPESLGGSHDGSSISL